MRAVAGVQQWIEAIAGVIGRGQPVSGCPNEQFAHRRKVATVDRRTDTSPDHVARANQLHTATFEGYPIGPHIAFLEYVDADICCFRQRNGGAMNGTVTAKQYKIGEIVLGEYLLLGSRRGHQLCLGS